MIFLAKGGQPRIMRATLLYSGLLGATNTQLTPAKEMSKMSFWDRPIVKKALLLLSLTVIAESLWSIYFFSNALVYHSINVLNCAIGFLLAGLAMSFSILAITEIFYGGKDREEEGSP
jgi:hypothetical protein